MSSKTYRTGKSSAVRLAVDSDEQHQELVETARELRNSDIDSGEVAETLRAIAAGVELATKEVDDARAALKATWDENAKAKAQCEAGLKKARDKFDESGDMNDAEDLLRLEGSAKLVLERHSRAITKARNALARAQHKAARAGLLERAATQKLTERDLQHELEDWGNDPLLRMLFSKETVRLGRLPTLEERGAIREALHAAVEFAKGEGRRRISPKSINGVARAVSERRTRELTEKLERVPSRPEILELFKSEPLNAEERRHAAYTKAIAEARAKNNGMLTLRAAEQARKISETA